MLATKSVSNLATMANERGPQIRMENSGEHGPKVPTKKRADSNELTFGTGKDLITYIFPDFKAVDYFRKDFVSLGEFHILEKTYASGFEIYLVDQWIRDRKIGSVASVFTGNSQSKVRVYKFTTIKKQSREYPPRFQEYLNELLLNHATFKKMDTTMNTDPSYTPPIEDGSEVPAYLLVSNISAMPHSLFLVPIPDGDARAVEQRYMVNSNLKKINCSGRSLSLLTEKVSDASEDKFRQMYCILNESVPIHFAILELVNIIQTCLFYFDLLDAKYADGLLCHKTEDAIKNWWNLIGLPHFNTKPNPKTGVLSSKTVAAIISLTVSVKLRLQLIGGCDVPKDIFDAESFMISIGHFQKQVKIEKRRKLNLLTLSRLFHYTNQHLSEKPKSFYSPFGNEQTLEDSDSYALYDHSFTNSANSGKAGSYSNSSLPIQAASAYRRNKIFYSKELKKLTNVVKNTVQDHIMVKEDQDDLYSDSSPTKPTKLRSKIVSKLSDNLVPADIETIDIETFAKKCIVGKTLQRLWIGLSSAEVKLAVELLDGEKISLSSSSNNQSDSGKLLRHHNNDGHHHSHHHRRHHRDEEAWAGLSSNDNNGYSFTSFRDSFATNQDLSLVADKSGRLGRMKLPFQTRKAPIKSDSGLVQANGFERNSSKDETHGTLLDTELQKLSESPPSLLSKRTSKPNSPVSDAKTGIGGRMNRRASYPFVKSPIEANFSAIETLHDEADKSSIQLHPLKRSLSFSALDGYFLDSTELSSYEKMRIDYIAQVLRTISLEDMKREYANMFTEKVTMKTKQANLDIHKIRNTHTMILHRKQRFESEYSAILEIKMRDLADNLDKMAFRSRDLIKKIDELDEHLNIFKSKLQSESMAKLDNMIDRVLHSAKFDYVFEDRDEKSKIIKSLTGAENLHNENNSTGSGLCIRLIIVYLYKILLSVLRIFHFDRSKMNLDRIRNQYKKLDPNREYISKIYKLVGHELSSDSTSEPTLKETNERN